MSVQEKEFRIVSPGWNKSNKTGSIFFINLCCVYATQCTLMISRFDNCQQVRLIGTQTRPTSEEKIKMSKLSLMKIIFVKIIVNMTFIL